MTPRPPRKLSFVINGRRVGTAHAEDARSSPGGAEYCWPRFDEEALTLLRGRPRDVLADVPLQDIISFLSRVGSQWQDDEYARRRLMITQLVDVSGFTEEMAVAEADLIAALLVGSARHYDSLDADLGDHEVLDTWVRHEDCLRRALPRGVWLHVLAGNVPIAGVLSAVRSLLTKNVTILKPAADDPVTAVSLALSFLDTDAEHPVARALDVVYWPTGDPLGQEYAGSVDGICAWGGQDAVEWASAAASSNAEVVLFGPKQSLDLVDAGHQDDLAEAARRVAHDVCMYDQGACFSARQVFVAGDAERFVRQLRDELDRYDTLLPARSASRDEEAAAALTILHHDFFGAATFEGSAGTWRVIVGEPGRDVTHPGRRTVLVHPVEDLREAYASVGPHVQTVGLHPWSLQAEHREALARLGVSRIVQAGLNSIVRLGGTHDGILPMSRLVRFASVETGSDRMAKGMSVPLDLTDFLEHRQFRELAF